ncbi:caspase-3-like [Plakobranchus ocellatus]|uniref:Caspase-3-like n=1 Tax=Plakobranchus ocellatus TaxID=259542 RepID=A0AAV4D3I7_9GAST|nr:caspase-3-like [Plakobranchus ocellatus]
MDSQSCIKDFRANFRPRLYQLKLCPALSDDYHLVSEVLNPLIHFISHHIIFANIKDWLVPIFTTQDLEHAEASGKGSIDIMRNICEHAKRMMLPEFVQFGEAIVEENSHVAEKLMERVDELLATSKVSADESVQNGAFSLQPRTNSSSKFSSVESANHFNSYGSASAGHSSTFADHRTSGRSGSGFQDSFSPLALCSNHTTKRNYTIQSSSCTNSTHAGCTALPSGQELSRIVRHSGQHPSEVYDMSTTTRGLALIINNEDFENFSKRSGSSLDVTNLYNMFHYIGFKVTIQRNKTAEEMKTLLRQFSQHKLLGTVSALALVILTHGGSNDCLFGTDGTFSRCGPVSGTFITKMDIIHMFKGSICRSMEGKPKLFIVQACRGEEENSAQCYQTAAKRAGLPTKHNVRLRSDAPSVTPTSVVNPSTTSSASSTYQHRHDSPGSIKSADTADMCFVYSSSYGYKAYRTRSAGSPFVQVFSSTVRRLAYEKEFRDIVQEIQRYFNTEPLPNNMMTLPDFSLQLMRPWYLNPPKWANSA